MTLKCIAGLETPDRGKIVLNEKIFYDSGKNINIPIKKRKVGVFIPRLCTISEYDCKSEYRFCTG